MYNERPLNGTTQATNIKHIKIETLSVANDILVETHQQQRDRLKPTTNDLSSARHQVNYDNNNIVNGKTVTTSTTTTTTSVVKNYERIIINDALSRRNHERSNKDNEKHYDQRETIKEVTKLKNNCFAPSNDVIISKTFEEQQKMETRDSAETTKDVNKQIPCNIASTAVIKIEHSGHQNGFEHLQNQEMVEKDHPSNNGFREESPLKETHNYDRHSELAHSKDHPSNYDHSGIAGDGSVRSDEGYHSHGYHDEVLTPPEDSSDSDDSDNNYVLDFR